MRLTRRPNRKLIGLQATKIMASIRVTIWNEFVHEQTNPEVGRIYQGKVRRIVEFGAFVEIFPGTDGLLHISQLDEKRVKTVTDVVKEGDIIPVKVLEVDKQGKIRLSLKEALRDQQGSGAES